MSRFEVVKEIASNQNYELLENHLHEDFMLIREEGLVLRDEYLEYVCLLSGFFGLVKCFPNGGSGSVSV